MRNIRIITAGISMILICILLQSCRSKEQKEKEMMRAGQKKFFWAISRNESDKIQIFLDKGLDPNYCRGDCGWTDSNPLLVVAKGFYDTYWRFWIGEEILDPTPDVVTLQILVANGADVNKFPYIWNRVYRYNNDDLNSLWGSRIKEGKPDGVEEDMKAYFIKDANRIIEVFLKAGANPDILGHPYPFSYEAMRARITDEQALEYFSKGTRAINEAIAKGIAWESQVDLLLQYTQLDEESLKAAERSNDPAMVKKIQKLWETGNRK